MSQNNQTDEKILIKISRAFEIPIYRYRNSELIQVFPEQAKEYPPPSFYVAEAQKDIFQITVMTSFSAYYGVLPSEKDQEEFYMFGPVKTTEYLQTELRKIQQQYQIPAKDEERDHFLLFLSGIPDYSLNRFSSILELIHQIINDGVPELAFGPKTAEHSEQIINESILNVYENKNQEEMNQTLENERVLLSIVENGDVKQASKIRENFFSFKTGILADNSLRNVKNLVISLIAVICRAANRGGAVPQVSFQLSDLYIQNTEKANTEEEAIRLIPDILVDFTTLVDKSKPMTNRSYTDMDQVIEYIRDHTGYPLSVSFVASIFGYNSDYLSSKFKKETGINLSAFINETKLEEARRLLEYTDKPVYEISEFLYFSNQSYFQNLFKKEYGITPKAYRHQSRKIR